MIPRRRGLVTGMVVGAAAASHSANKAQAQQMQYQQQMAMQADLAQAQAEAKIAKQQQQQQQQPVGSATPAQQPSIVYVTQPAPPQQQQQQQIPQVPQAVRPPVYLMLTAAHIVDEAAMAPYGIISVPQGATVRLVAGTLEGGLGAPYQDYIQVEYQGRVGKISRLVVALAPPPPSSAPPPPPAIHT